MTPTWFVAQSRAGREWGAAYRVERQGYEIYLPECANERRRAVAPLFPNHFFVKMPKHGRWMPVLSTRGVTRVIMSGERPGICTQYEIERLRSREDDGLIILPNYGPRQGDAVRVARGPYLGWEGLHHGQRGDDRVAVLFRMMGRNKVVEFDEGALRAVAA